jgi:hypothetical protein
MFRESNFTIDEIRDSFEMFCKPIEENSAIVQAPAIALEIPATQLKPINISQPVAVPSSVAVAAPIPVLPIAVPSPTPGPINPPAPPAVSPKSPPPLPPAPPVVPNPPPAENKPTTTPPNPTTIAGPPGIVPTNQLQAASTSQAASKLRLKRSKSQGASLERCFLSDVEVDCALIAAEVSDQNKAKCLRIAMNEVGSNNVDIKLFMKMSKSDWASNYFWLSMLQPENPFLQQDIYLRHTEENEMQLSGRHYDMDSNPMQSMVERKLCKAQCLNTVATRKCGCTTLKQYSSITGLKMCSNEIMYDCVYYKGATVETNQCLKSCDPMLSLDFQYTISVKSSLTDLASEGDDSNVLLDIKLKYKDSFYKGYSVFCVSIVLAVVGLLCIVLFACCCAKAVRQTS